VTFDRELKRLDECHRSLRESNSAMRLFILSDRFLADFIEFEKLLGDFQDKVVTLVEIVQMPTPSLPPSSLPLAEVKTPEEVEKEKEGAGFTMPRAAVVSAAILASTVAVYHNLVPPTVLVGVVASSIGLMFFPQIRDIIASLQQREEKEEPVSMRLEDWINESLSRIRSLHMSARFLVKVQDQTKKTSPYYADLGLDEALYDRGRYFNETLPSEFLSRIGRIMVACDKNVWARRSLIVNAIVMAKQASVKG
jgi:hypothetical protein